MNNTTSPAEVILSAADRAGIDLTLTDVKNRAGQAEKAWVHYKLVYNDLITSVAWTFAVKRETLTLDGVAGPESPWAYYYQFPVDMLQPWNIYPFNYVSYLDLPSSQPLPISDGLIYLPGADSGFAEIIGGRVSADTEVNVYYTHSGEIDYHDWTQPFVKSLEASLVERLLASRDKTGEDYIIKAREAQREIREGRSREAIANRKAYRVPPATIIVNALGRSSRV